VSKDKIGFITDAATIERIDEEADQLGMSRAEYIRTHLHAGRRLFRSSGKLDRQLLSQLVEGDESAHLSDDLTTDADGLADEIRAALPADKERALTTDEVRKAVFGTTDEQRDQVEQALEYLAERDQIDITVNGEFHIDE
jgi:histidyl-tRNA synthetase